MVWLVQPPPGMYIRVWEIICILLIYVGDLVRRKMVKERLQHTNTRNIEYWKRCIKAMFIKQLMNFVILTDMVPNRWDYRCLLKNPILYTYGIQITQASTSGYKMAVNI